MLAARRQRKWKLYDVGTFKNSLSHCLGNDHVGGNLFEVIFELSFRRQGALLVYDPEHRIRGHILNPESIIFAGWKADGEAAGDDCGQALLGPLLEDTAIGKKAGSVEPQAAVDRNGLRRRRRGLRRPASVGRGNADPLASQRGESTGGPDDGGPLLLPLGRLTPSRSVPTARSRSTSGARTAEAECDAEMHFL